MKYKFKIMKYIVYLTTNLVNNKIYVGVHKTENPNKFDGYIGNGVNCYVPSSINNPTTPFHYAVKKYGFSAFKRSIIKIFDNLDDALQLEADIVNESFIERHDTYNITLGGGMPPLGNKKVYQYTLNGIFLRQYNSITEASIELNVSDSSIGKAALYKRTSCNSLWTFDKFDRLDLSKYNIYNSNIEIYCYKENCEYFCTYPSMSSCSKSLGCNLSNVQRALKTGGLVKGYYLSKTLLGQFVKQKSERLTGEIHRYDLSGIYIDSFNSLSEAEKKLNMSLSGLNSAIKLHNSYYKGFLWKRGEKLNNLEPYKNPKTKRKKIGQYSLDGELIKVFNSLRECRKEFPNVSKVLNGIANHCHNFKFKYIEEVSDIV